MTMTSSQPPPAATATSSSLLDKPLHLLTDDDISQVTREQCRRYLTLKGMRRPSWNKAQAIQQVIMLKALLEQPSPDNDVVVSPKLRILRTRVVKGTSGDIEVSVTADEGLRDEIDQTDVARDDDIAPPGITNMTNEEKGQMSEFFSGKVSAYDDVPAEKAWTLLQLAANPLQFPQEAPFDENVTAYSLTCHLPAPAYKASADSSAMLLPNLQTAEGSASRKASVQRYLEKRKDRFRSKRKAEGPASASLDAYLGHQIQNQNQNEQLNRSSTCSEPQIRPPNTSNHFN